MLPYVLLRAVYGQNFEKSQMTRTLHSRNLELADRTSSPYDEKSMQINFWQRRWGVRGLRGPCVCRGSTVLVLESGHVRNTCVARTRSTRQVDSIWHRSYIPPCVLLRAFYGQILESSQVTGTWHVRGTQEIWSRKATQHARRGKLAGTFSPACKQEIFAWRQVVRTTQVRSAFSKSWDHVLFAVNRVRTIFYKKFFFRLSCP